MRYIKEGVKDLHAYKCPYCGCEFELDLNDYADRKTIREIQEIKGSPEFGFGIVNIEKVECPFCEREFKPVGD